MSYCQRSGLRIQMQQLSTVAENHPHIFYLFIYVFSLFRATLAAYGGSRARDLIGAAATGLCQSHSNVGSEPVSAAYTTAHSNAGSLTH